MALLAVCAVVVVALFVDAVVRAGIGEALLLAPWMLLALWLIYAIGVASHVRGQADGVLVQNALRRTFAPWPRVRRIDMRWQVEIALDDGSILTCFGGPARMRPQRLGPGRTREDVGGEADDLVARLRRAKADAGPARGEAAPILRSWDLPALGALLAIAVWAAIAVLVTR